MQRPKSLDDELHAQIMSEMAQSFFSRRKDMDQRLERFAALAQEVKLNAKAALAAWRGVFLLLGAGALCAELPRVVQGGPPDGADLDENLPAPGLARPLALTGQGRLRKALFLAYQLAFEATVAYQDGVYQPDPKDPRRMRLTPNRQSLKDLAQDLNRDIAKLNQAQCPSVVLGYAQSLNPNDCEGRDLTGGLMGQDACQIDREMAFKPVDFQGLGLPDIKIPRPLVEVKADLARLAKLAWAKDPARAKLALARLTKARDK